MIGAIAPASTESGQRAEGGFHPVEWLAEGLGTAILLIGGLSAVCLDFGDGSPVAAHLPSVSLRLLLTGLLFGGTGSLVAVSPLGRRSGAHLNPVVTLAFRLTGMVHAHDVAGYIAAQCVGALAGAGVVRLLWGRVALSIHDGTTEPAARLGDVPAVGIEALMTALLIGTILLFVSRRRLARWTPLAVWLVVAILVWRGAAYTGSSLNPARSLGPALVAAHLTNYWVYVLGPTLGGLGAALVALALGFQPLTAKLCHDSSYTSTMASALPVQRHAERQPA